MFRFLGGLSGQKYGRTRSDLLSGGVLQRSRAYLTANIIKINFHGHEHLRRTHLSPGFPKDILFSDHNICGYLK